jgi:hypothetical protein
MSSSADDLDDTLSPFPPVPPKPGTAKFIGTLSIIIAACWILCGTCSGLQLSAQSAFGPMMAAQQQQMQATLEAERAAQLQNLRDREKAAQTDQDKAKIQAEIKTLQAQPVPKFPDMTKLWIDDRLLAYFAVDICTGLILNAILLIAGIGLVNLKEWGRVTGLWVLAIKIVRLVILYGIGILVIVPIMTQKFIDFFEELGKQMPQGQPGAATQQMAQMGATMGTMMTVSMAGIIVGGFLLWGTMLWFLSRPGVKVACTTPPEMPMD